MGKTNKVCFVCGSEYQACSNCEELKSYKSIVCSIQHYVIWTSIIKMRDNLATKQEVLEDLNLIGIKYENIDSLEIKDGLKEILKNKLQPDEIEIVTGKDVSLEKSKTSFKKSKKVTSE